MSDTDRAIVHNNEINPGTVRNGKTILCWKVTDTSPVGQWYFVKRAHYRATIEFTDGSKERVLTHG
jgi:hypothetical protein